MGRIAFFFHLNRATSSREEAASASVVVPSCHERRQWTKTTEESKDRGHVVACYLLLRCFCLFSMTLFCGIKTHSIEREALDDFRRLSVLCYSLTLPLHVTTSDDVCCLKKLPLTPDADEISWSISLLTTCHERQVDSTSRGVSISVATVTFPAESGSINRRSASEAEAGIRRLR